MNRAVFIGRVKLFDYLKKTLTILVPKDHGKGYDSITCDISAYCKPDWINILKKNLITDKLIKLECFLEIQNKQNINIVVKKIDFMGQLKL